MPHIPVHPSAEKHHRQSLKRQQRNRAVKTRVRTASKNALDDANTIETLVTGKRRQMH